jgi:hypothetical protein
MRKTFQQLFGQDSLMGVPCNHEEKTQIDVLCDYDDSSFDASYDSDDSSLSSSGDSSWSSASSLSNESTFLDMSDTISLNVNADNLLYDELGGGIESALEAILRS